MKRPPAYLPRTGALVAALGLSLIPATGRSDHGTHDHDLLRELVGQESTAAATGLTGPATQTKARKSRSAQKGKDRPGKSMTLAAVTMPSFGVMSDANFNPVRKLLDERHGSNDGDMDHQAAHGDYGNISVDMLERNLRKVSAKSFMVAQAQIATPDQVGQWSTPITMPVIPIFTALLPNGKVLMWDSVGDGPTESYAVQNFTRAAVWDPDTNTSTRIDVSGFNIFCSGFAHMSDGRIFVAGGNKDTALNGIRQTHVFDYNTNTWSRGPDMAYERWYPSVAALSNGEHFIMGGGPDTHEVRQVDNTLRTLTGAVISHAREYPFIQTGLDGRVVYAGPQDQLRFIDTNGTGAVQNVGARDGTYRSYGSYALYDIGKMIVTGGASSTNTATLLNMSATSLTASAANSMRFGRRQHNATVLADGSVLVTGGLSSGAGLVDLNAGVYAAELWSPSTGQWSTLSSAAITRQYHSVAMLLPDGRVFTGGGGICGTCQQVGYMERNAEIFTPPYLFRKDGSGQLAPRPTISNVQAAVSHAQTFNIETPDAGSIAKVAMVRLGAPTHSQDQDQRYIPLTFTVGTGNISAVSPTNASVAPPGYYMLFVVDTSGVPSVAKMVQIASVAPPKGTGTGLTGQYFNNMTLSGSAVLQRVEAVNFNWGTGSPGTGVAVDRFSVRWVGQVEAPLTGSYQFQTVSDDGIRLWVNGQQIINNWTDHAPTTNTSAAVSLTGGNKYSITLEFYENGGGATASLAWKLPNGSAFAAIPVDRLYPGTPPVPTTGPFTSTLVAKHSGRCLDVPGSSTTQGVQLQQYTCNGTNAQSFNFAPVAGKVDTYAISNRNSGQCLDISGASLANGAAVIQWACNSANNQQFTLVAMPAAGSKAFQVRSVSSGKCVEVNGSLLTNSAKVVQRDCTGANNQIWTVGGKV